jgi:alpha-mannosidase
MAPRVVHVVPHTHWDREWYAPFQTFRMRLVDLLDELLPRLDGDPSYRHFMLDGQMAVIDDYLAVRPEAADAVRRLARSGRMSVGPWYAQPDEFLVSGETLVRNLQLGLARAADFGGAMEVGYLPDMFGHIAQMPQILAQFGFAHAVVWRGVPSAVDRSGFWWESPDGSRVRAEYLPQGYGNGASVPDGGAELARRVGEFEDLHGKLLTGPVLWMNGTDHLIPQPWLGRVVAEANAGQERFRFEVSSLVEHLDAAPTDDLPRWNGELRSGARANLLMGVGSNRVDVKQAAARAERGLERLAEPLSALFLPAEAWPEALLAEAWQRLVLNSAHDSICACSHDDVVDAVLGRFAEASHIASGLVDRALTGLGHQVGGRRPVVVNPTARTRGGLVEVLVPGDGEVPGTQTVEVRHRVEVLARFDSPSLAAGLTAELDYVPRYLSATIETLDGDGSVAAELFTVTRTGDGRLLTPADREVLDGILADTSTRPTQVVVTQHPRRKVLSHVAGVPGFGWRRWQPPAAGDPGPTPVAMVPRQRPPSPFAITNGLVTVAYDGSDSTFSIDGHTGLGRLVDGGDGGDTYNYCPPRADLEVSVPTQARMMVTEDGPLRARMVMQGLYAWPAHSDLDQRSEPDLRTELTEPGRRPGGVVETEVTTTVEVRAGERLVRVEVSFTNRARDHRLRVLLPLPRPADSSVAECAFGAVERGLTAEGGSTEAGLATFPSRRFVQAGGLTVVHEGLLEYELVDVRDGRAHALALTLLRATGALSRGPMTTRPLPAGPFHPLEGPQMQGPVTARFALVVGDDVDPWAAADDAFLPLLTTDPDPVTADGDDHPIGPPDEDGSTAAPLVPAGDVTGQALSVTGAEVSALRRTAGGHLELRVFNPTGSPTTVSIPGRAGHLVDLRGTPLGRFQDAFDLGPYRIATAVLDG